MVVERGRKHAVWGAEKMKIVFGRIRWGLEMRTPRFRALAFIAEGFRPDIGRGRGRTAS